MYFTDRGLEELASRRGQEELTFSWLAEKLRTFTDLNPEFDDSALSIPPGVLGESE